MSDKQAWLQRIPIWLPVGVLFVGLVAAIAEDRWALRNHLEKEEAEAAKWEEHQWEAIANLNKQAVRAEEQLKFHRQMIERLESR